MIEEREGERVYICDTCGEEHFGDNWGLAGCLVLTDERVQPPQVIGVWCNEACLNKWLRKRDNIIYQITVGDVLDVADKIGIPIPKLNEAVIAVVQDSLQQQLNWQEVVEHCLMEARIKFSLN